MPFPLDFEALALAAIASAFPVTVWYFVLRQKKHEHSKKRLLLTFLLAGSGAIGFWFAKPFVISWLGEADLWKLFGILVAFGVVIEYFRNYIVRLCGVGFIRSIDDIIDLSFAAALGFTFFENFFYFSQMFTGQIEFLAGKPVTALKYFLLHVFFLPPIHIFCTGIFGYFYGVGVFGNDQLRAANQKTFWYRLFAILLFFFPRKSRFKAVKIAQGTCVSAISFGIFFALLQQDPRVSELLIVLGLPDISKYVDEQLMPLVAFLFFKIGTVYFFLLMDKKRRWDTQKLLITKV